MSGWGPTEIAFSMGALAVITAGFTIAFIHVLREVQEIKAAINEVHLGINSRLTQLLETTASSSRAAGALQERERSSLPIALSLHAPVQDMPEGYQESSAKIIEPISKETP